MILLCYCGSVYKLTLFLYLPDHELTAKQCAAWHGPRAMPSAALVSGKEGAAVLPPGLAELVVWAGRSAGAKCWPNGERPRGTGCRRGHRGRVGGRGIPGRARSLWVAEAWE